MGLRLAHEVCLVNLGNSTLPDQLAITLGKIREQLYVTCHTKV